MTSCNNGCKAKPIIKVTILNPVTTAVVSTPQALRIKKIITTTEAYLIKLHKMSIIAVPLRSNFANCFNKKRATQLIVKTKIA